MATPQGQLLLPGIWTRLVTFHTRALTGCLAVGAARVGGSGVGGGWWWMVVAEGASRCAGFVYLSSQLAHVTVQL